jgi:hypothetical protein
MRGDVIWEPNRALMLEEFWMLHPKADEVLIKVVQIGNMLLRRPFYAPASVGTESTKAGTVPLFPWWQHGQRSLRRRGHRG